MIAKITGGAGFGGALNYQTKPKEPRGKQEREQYREKLREAQQTPGESAPPFEAGERHRVIGGNMSGQTRAELTREFETIARQRPDIEKPVHHASLSSHENDRISVEEWREIAAEYIERMGYKDAPYVVIQHRDGKTDHIHILTSRVDVRGNVVSDWQCRERAEVVLRDIEREHGLKQIKSSHEVERAAPKRGEIETFNRTGRLSAKMSMQSHVELALKDKPTATEFIERLQIAGVEAIPYIDKTGRATGISFRKGKELMKGSDLGRGFSWNALQQRGLSYEPERDRTAIEAAKERAVSGREVVVAPQSERTFTDVAKDLGRQAGEHMLNQMNPLRQIESQVHTLASAGSRIADGVTALHDLFSNRNEQPARSAMPQPDGHDELSRLQQATGLDPAKNDRDALDRLKDITGRDSPADLTQTLDKTAPELTPTLEPEIEEHVLAPVIELML